MLARVPPTVSEIFASVAKPPSLLKLEGKFAAVRDQRTAKHREMVDTIAANDSRQLDAQVNQLVGEEATLDAEVKRLRAELLPARAEHAAALSSALAAVRRQSARRALDALDEVREAVAVLNESAGAIDMAGGETIRVAPLSQLLASAEAACRRIAS